MNLRNSILILCTATLFSSCHIYKSYKRPEDINVDNFYSNVDSLKQNEEESLGKLAWQELFKDEDLKHLIDIALVKNADIQKAALSIKQAKAGLLTSRMAYMPKLALSPQGTVTSFDFGKATQTYNLGAVASWQVDLFGQILNPKRRAKMNVEQAKAGEHAVRSALIANVANVYYSLLTLDKQLEITREIAGLLQQNVNTIEAMFEGGMLVTSAAVEQSRSAYAQVVASISDLEVNIENTESALCLLIHEPTHRVKRGKLSNQELVENFSVGVPLALLSNRPDVRAAEMKLAACYYGSNAARSAFYPNISINGQAGWVNNFGTIFSPAKMLASAIGNITLPLLNRGENIARLRQAKAEEAKAKLDFETALLKAGNEVNSLMYKYERTITKSNARAEQVRAAHKAAEDTKVLFELGNATYLEVLSALQGKLSAEQAEASDKLEHLQTIVSIYQALGGC